MCILTFSWFSSSNIATFSIKYCAAIETFFIVSVTFKGWTSMFQESNFTDADSYVLFWLLRTDCVEKAPYLYLSSASQHLNISNTRNISVLYFCAFWPYWLCNLRDIFSSLNNGTLLIPHLFQYFCRAYTPCSCIIHDWFYALFIGIAVYCICSDCIVYHMRL